MKTAIIAEIGWHEALKALEQLSEKIEPERPCYFARSDISRLQAIIRTIEYALPEDTL